jgi:hypothetical protein
MSTSLPPNTYIGGHSGQASPAKIWSYPDGTVSSVEPANTQMFFLWGVNKHHPDSCWQWNSKTQQWIDVTAATGPNDNLDLVKEFERMVAEPKKCECGSESVGSSKHSTWCQKWSADP